MSARPRRRIALRAQLAVSQLAVSQLAVCMLAVAAVAGPASLARAGTGAEDPPDPIAVVLTGLTPLDAAADGVETVTITGRVANVSDDRVTSLSAYLRVSRIPFADPELMAQVLDPAYRPGLRRANFVPIPEALDPGATATFTLEFPVEDLRLSEPGVYPVGIEILGAPPSGIRGELGRTMTALPWLPPAATEDLDPTDVALVWPLTAPVDRAADGAYLSDELGAALEDGGRLDRAVDLSADAGVTWLLDPALAEAATDLADGYVVRTGSGADATLGDGAHAADAARWLDAVRTRADAGAVIVAPYADVDLVALVRGGLDEVAAEAVTAAGTVAAVAGVDPTDGALRPPGGAVDARTLEVLADAGIGTASRPVVLDRGATTAADDERSVRLPGDLRALLADPTLPEGASDETGSIQARQLLLGATAIAALEAADSGRVPAPLLVAADESSDGTPVSLVDALDLDVPWIEPVTLDELAAPRPADEVDLEYGDEHRAAELPADHVRAIAAVRDLAAVLEAITGGAAIAGTTEPTVRLLQRAGASAWRAEPARAAAYVADLTASYDTALGSVHLLPANGITLSSDTGRFPLTIQNDLPTEVTVDLTLTSQDPARLRISGVEGLTLAAGASTTVDVEAAATSNGAFVVSAQLATPDGVPFGAVTSLEINATDYDRLAWIVMGVAGGLLVLASGWRITQRIRAARRADGDPGGAA